MGPWNTLVIRYCCHGLKYNRQEFFLRSGLKLDLDLTPSHSLTFPNNDSFPQIFNIEILKGIVNIKTTTAVDT